jgi:hypothetical protein
VRTAELKRLERQSRGLAQSMLVLDVGIAAARQACDPHQKEQLLG